jgi:tetratricopeptide (TPR) repeat protein
MNSFSAIRDIRVIRGQKRIRMEFFAIFASLRSLRLFLPIATLILRTKREDRFMSEPTIETSAPKLWHVPFARNIFFTGRDELLADLRKSLGDTVPNANIQVVHGLGGIGKTQLALEYAYRNRADYTIVWWLTADEPSSLALSYARLAQALGMKFSDNTSLDAIRHQLRRELAKHSGYLLIFDNAPGPQDVRNFLPQDGKGHVLITSRNPVWGGLGHAFQLRPLAREHSIRLLLDRSGAKEDESQANVLAQALGDLPLALEQAAACLEQTKQPFAEYLASFENHWGELLRRGRPSADYPDTAAMVLELSLRQVETVSTAATNLMNLCAYLAPDEIPFSLLREAAPEMQHPVSQVCTDPVKLDRAVAALLRFSLLEATATGLTIHRLVQAIARDRMAPEIKEKWARVALRVAGTFKFDSSDIHSWPRAGQIVPHVIAATSHCRKLQIELPTCADLLNESGRYLHKRAQLTAAKDVLETSLALHKEVYGESHAKVAGVTNNLGRVLKDLGRDLDSIALFETALTLDEHSYGATDPHVATVVNNYGISLRNTGDFDTARAQFEWAYDVYNKHYGPAHIKTASALNNLAYVLKDQGFLADALAKFKEALKIAEATINTGHPTHAAILHNIAETLRAQGQPNDAMPYAKRALSVTEGAFGVNHPDTARDLQTLGECELALTKTRQAKEHFQHALAILRPTHGDSHARTVTLRKKIDGIQGM